MTPPMPRDPTRLREINARKLKQAKRGFVFVYAFIAKWMFIEDQEWRRR
jgi:hypothetical protein